MNKESLYQSLNNQVVALIEDETNLIANLANVSALLNLSLEDINWVGFYLLENDTLVLGPFQGNPACVRIPVGKGVCGTAFAEKQTQRIDNVHDFEGHIACDAASNSEVVIPLIKDGNYIGVLDIDSPSLSRFDSDDQTGLERIMASLAEHL
ncbi:GAF domain-containing protein [Pseudoalteromonas sp. T1lg24]|uniref:GAF domain-containing protein n=1 Tax=Pseudoalteromonas sp. T1lg24 TaxID=2077099 RepID=UPI000CF674C7|nr:GAF domain-containing protein [Pseudoalteromonas sp. T1lg24]